MKRQIHADQMQYSFMFDGSVALSIDALSPKLILQTDIFYESLAIAFCQNF